MRKRAVSFCMAAIMAAGLLSGCSSQTGSGNTAASETKEEVTTSAAPVAAETSGIHKRLPLHSGTPWAASMEKQLMHL